MRCLLTISILVALSACSENAIDHKSAQADQGCQRWSKTAVSLNQTYETSSGLKLNCIELTTADDSIAEHSNLKVALWDTRAEVYPAIFLPMNDNPIKTQKVYNLHGTTIGDDDLELLDASIRLTKLADSSSNLAEGTVDLRVIYGGTGEAEWLSLSFSSPVTKE